MVIALLSFLGREYRLRLVLEEVRPSLPPPTFETTGVEVSTSAPSLPSNVFRLPTRAA